MGAGVQDGRMEGLTASTAERVLGPLADIPDGGSKGYGPARGGFLGLFAVRRGDRVFVYVNSCPHIGVPLDFAPDRFLSTDGSHILCATHGARFRIEDGECFGGPCVGDVLEAVPARIVDGMIRVPADAGL